MSYSRQNPSPQYLELLEQYKIMHKEGCPSLNIAPEKLYEGYMVTNYVTEIKKMIEKSGSKTILDYGSGKGHQYVKKFDFKGKKFKKISDYWDVDQIVCYEPAYPPFENLPEGKFDGVISIDVLEHIPFDDIDWVLKEIFGFANKFVFITVSGRPSNKVLPSGDNAHCTVRSVKWWTHRLNAMNEKFPSIDWKLICTVANNDHP